MVAGCILEIAPKNWCCLKRTNLGISKVDVFKIQICKRQVRKFYALQRNVGDQKTPAVAVTIRLTGVAKNFQSLQALRAGFEHGDHIIAGWFDTIAELLLRDDLNFFALFDQFLCFLFRLGRRTSIHDDQPVYVLGYLGNNFGPLTCCIRLQVLSRLMPLFLAACERKR